MPLFILPWIFPLNHNIHFESSQRLNPLTCRLRCRLQDTIALDDLDAPDDPTLIGAEAVPDHGPMPIMGALRAIGRFKMLKIGKSMRHKQGADMDKG